MNTTTSKRVAKDRKPGVHTLRLTSRAKSPKRRQLGAIEPGEIDLVSGKAKPGRRVAKQQPAAPIHPTDAEIRKDERDVPPTGSGAPVTKPAPAKALTWPQVVGLLKRAKLPSGGGRRTAVTRAGWGVGKLDGGRVRIEHWEPSGPTAEGSAWIERYAAIMREAGYRVAEPGINGSFACIEVY